MSGDEIVAIRRPSRAKEIAKRFFGHENAILGFVLAGIIGAMAGITGRKSLGATNMMNILLQSSMRGVSSIGQAFVIFTAGIDLSVEGVVLMSAILGATLMTKVPFFSIVSHPWPFFVGVPIMLLMGTAWGVVNGSLVSRVGIPPLIATLGIWQITNGLGFYLCKGATITQQPDALLFLGSGRIAGVYVPVIIFIVVVVISYFALNHTTYGRAIYAVGGNPTSAWLSGINVRNTIFSVYAVSGFLTSLAGVIATARNMSASMLTLQGLLLDTIASVVIGGVSLAGGKGNVIGVVIGVMIIGVINNAMTILGASPAMIGIAKGTIIITAVVIDYWRKRGR